VYWIEYLTIIFIEYDPLFMSHSSILDIIIIIIIIIIVVTYMSDYRWGLD
jgi:hypothetical protein